MGMRWTRPLLATLFVLFALPNVAAEAQLRRGPIADVAHHRYEPHAAREAAHRGLAQAYFFLRSGTATAEAHSPTLLLQTAANANLREVLPPELPPLPGDHAPELASILRAAREHAEVHHQYLYLERQVSLLRGSGRDSERALGRRLNDYLAHYKTSWGRSFVEARLQRFAAEARNDRSWSLVEQLERGDLEDHEVTRVQDQLALASRLILNVVHPQLRLRVPPLRVRLGRGRTQGISRENGVYHLDLAENVSVTDVLHEYGHMIENAGGLSYRGTAFHLLLTRADGRYSEPLRNFVSFPYPDGVRAFPGGFVDPYMGREYADGFTEILSMGLERLQGPAAIDFLFADGDYLLHVLHALQREPNPLDPLPL